MKKVPVIDFKEAWSTIAADAEVVETFSLTYPSIKAAMDEVISFLGMQPCDNSDMVSEGSRTHTVLLSGIFLGGVQVSLFPSVATQSPHPHPGGRLLCLSRQTSTP